MANVLEIKDLNKTIDGKEILKNVNLTIEKPEVVSIIGPSGSGKSTLLRSINFLEKPTSGTVSIDGTVLTDENIQMMRPQIGMVFQGANLFPHMRVIENVTFGARMTAKNAAARENLSSDAYQMIGDFHLISWAQSYPSSLSGGMQQRVAIMRNLMMKPKIMIFDEATSALDPRMTQYVLDAIKKLADAGKTTIIIVTHEMDFVSSLGSRVIVMKEGEIVKDENSMTKADLHF